MRPLEFYAKLSIRDLEQFKRAAAALATAATANDSGVLRCDWYLNEATQESVAMLVWRDRAALQAHRGRAALAVAALSASCECALTSLGELSTAVRAELGDCKPQILRYADGLTKKVTAAGAPIEIATKFHIRAGMLDVFKRDAIALTDIVRREDPGTIRYDWFYDDANLLCYAMDTYRDSEAMFVHMRNCHAAHEKLLQHSAMVTEFLGALPAPAAAAVAKYNPYVAAFFFGGRQENVG